jgi:hypothetical protein
LAISILVGPAQAIAAGRLEEVPLTLGYTLFGFVLVAIYFALLHLGYIAMMALVDFIRLMIDLEGNTRGER